MPILKLLILMGQILLFVLFSLLRGHCCVWFRIFSCLTCLCFSSSHPDSSVPVLFSVGSTSYFSLLISLLGCSGLCRGQLPVCTHSELLIIKSFFLIWTVSVHLCGVNAVFFCVCVCVCTEGSAVIDRRAVPFQLCCSLTHLSLHYAAFMLFLRSKLHF